MPRRASQPGSSAWSAAAWRAIARASSKRPTLSRLVASAPASSTRVRGDVDRAHRVGDAQRLGRPAGAGEQAGPPGVDGGDLVGIGEPLARRFVGGERAVEVAVAEEAGVGQPLGEVGPAGVARARRPTPRRRPARPRRGRPSSSAPRRAPRRGRASPGRRRRRRSSSSTASAGSWPASASRAAPQQPLAGDLAARGDPPQGDLQHVLAAAGAVGLDHVGQLGLDAPQPQRRQAGPQHLAVERVGQAHGRPPARGARPRSRPLASSASSVRGAVAAARGRRGRTARTRRAARAAHGPRGVDAGEVLGHQLVERGRGRQRPGQLPGAAGVGQHAALAAPRTSSVSTCRLPPDRRASSARAVSDTGPSSARWSSAPSSSGSSGSISMRTRWPSRWRTVSRGRRRATGAHRADQEHGARHDERHEDGDRGVVEQVEVVDEQHQPVVAGQPPQLGAGGVEQAGALVVADAELGRSGRRAAGGRARRAGSPASPGGRPPARPAAAALGEAQRLLGQARLADAGRAVQHDAGPRRVAVVRGPAPRAAPTGRSAATVRSSDDRRV